MDDFVIELIDVLEAKGVEMIPRRKSFDPREARIFQATRQDHMPSTQLLRMTNAAKRIRTWKAIRFFWQNNDGAVLLRDRNNLSKTGRTAFGLRAKCEARVERPQNETGFDWKTAARDPGSATLVVRA